MKQYYNGTLFEISRQGIFVKIVVNDEIWLCEDYEVNDFIHNYV